MMTTKNPSFCLSSPPVNRWQLPDLWTATFLESLDAYSFPQTSCKLIYCTQKTKRILFSKLNTECLKEFSKKAIHLCIYISLLIGVSSLWSAVFEKLVVVKVWTIERPVSIYAISLIKVYIGIIYACNVILIAKPAARFDTKCLFVTNNSYAV